MIYGHCKNLHAKMTVEQCEAYRINPGRGMHQRLNHGCRRCKGLVIEKTAAKSRVKK